MARRDGFEGWTPAYERAYQRIFYGDNPSPHDVVDQAEQQQLAARVATALGLVLRRYDGEVPSGWTAEWVDRNGVTVLHCCELSTGWSCDVQSGGLLPWTPEFKRRRVVHEGAVARYVREAVDDEDLRRRR